MARSCSAGGGRAEDRPGAELHTDGPGPGTGLVSGSLRFEVGQGHPLLVSVLHAWLAQVPLGEAGWMSGLVASSRAIKRVTGQSPDAWRREVRGGAFA